MNRMVGPYGDHVKGHAEDRTRCYDARGRRDKARGTRQSVVTAARELLEERGFAATTMAEVARRAGVSPETVYKGFGTKAALVKEVFDVAMAGDDESVVIADREEVQRIRAESDLRTKLRLFAESAAVRAERSAGVQLALRNGAPADRAVDELWQRVQAERLTGMTMLAQHLLATGQLRPGIDVEEVRDVVWAAISVEVYDLLVLQRGWTRAAYADWLARTLIASIAGQNDHEPL